MNATVQYTIRNIPEHVDVALRQRAKEEGKSLNKTVLEALESGLNLDGKRVYHDLDHLIGTWKPNPEFDKIMEDHRKIDPELWK